MFIQVNTMFIHSVDTQKFFSVRAKQSIMTKQHCLGQHQMRTACLYVIAFIVSNATISAQIKEKKS